MANLMWVQKYSPKKLEEMLGHSGEIENIRKWAEAWEKGEIKKPLLIYGPPGIGKTLLAQTIAKEKDWDIVEMNASDMRDKESIQKIMGLASSGSTLFGNRRLILLDEVDGLQSSDRGGAGAIAKIIREGQQPIILTANDLWAAPLAYIKILCEPIQFKRINYRTIANRLKSILKEEKIEFQDVAIEEIAKRANGDLRAAILDLQAQGMALDRLETMKEFGQRDHEVDIFESVRKVFKSMEFAEAKRANEGLDMDFDMFVNWIDENIPVEYEDQMDIARAYDALSRGNIFRGRILNRQAWELLKYANDLSTAGVALAKDEKYHKFVRYNFPQIIKKLSASKGSRNLRKSIGVKVGEVCHCSTKEGYFAYAGLLKMELDKEESAGKVMEFFGFSVDEAEYLLGKKAKYLGKMVKEKELDVATHHTEDDEDEENDDN